MRVELLDNGCLAIAREDQDELTIEISVTPEFPEYQMDDTFETYECFKSFWEFLEYIANNYDYLKEASERGYEIEIEIRLKTRDGKMTYLTLDERNRMILSIDGMMEILDRQHKNMMEKLKKIREIVR